MTLTAACRRVGSATLATLLVGGLIAVSQEPSAAAAVRCGSTTPGDVNGDGYAEVAVRSREPERVHVFYGHPGGLQVEPKGSARNDQAFTQDTRGVPGAAGAHSFGKATAFGDFNADGCADLAIGAPRDDAGSVTVLYGSPTGLTTTGAKRVPLTGTPLADDPHGINGGDFGSAMVAGDLNGDGVDDLAVSAPDAVDGGSDSGCGAVLVLRGGRSGLSSPTSADIVRGDENNKLALALGSELAIGDFDGDRRLELAAAVAWHNEIWLVKFGPGGVVRDQYRILESDMPGLPPSIRFATFGYQMAAGDTNGDGKDELVVMVGLETSQAVVVLPGSADGPTGEGSRLWTAQDAGLTDPGYTFADSLAMARLDADRTADLIIGSPDARAGRVAQAGAVSVLFGGSRGLSMTGRRVFHQAVSGIPGSAEQGDEFGASVTGAYLQDASQASLIVGSPGEDIGSTRDAGQITQLTKSSAGPSARGSKSFTLDSRGVKGSARAKGVFGRSLSEA